VGVIHGKVEIFNLKVESSVANMDAIQGKVEMHTLTSAGVKATDFMNKPKHYLISYKMN